MRLTLRTMLAYLDDILDPTDAQDLGRKIEESEFASNLVGRIRDVSRRLRLGAPKLTGRGMGLDPNTVAEYLDNTLAVARVPDFEKICLESDMHLAEVACSHQILALVLGGPAEVNPACRQRMYKLTARPEEATFQIAPAAPEQPQSLYTPRPRAEVPDYLRDESSRLGGWLKIAAAILVLAGLAVAVLMAVGPFDWPSRVALAPAAGEGAGVAQPQAGPDQPGKMGDVTGIVPRDAALPEAPDREGAGAPGLPDRGSEASDPADDGGQFDPTTEDAVDPMPNTANSGDSQPFERNGTSDAAATVGNSIPLEPVDANSSDEVIADDGSDPISAATDRTEEAATETNDPLPGTAPPAGTAPLVDPAAAAPREPVGRYISAASMLLRWESDAVGWTRLPSQATVHVDEQLLSLPTFRSTVALSAGVTMQLVGDTQVRFQSPVALEVPSVDIGYGRLVLMTAGRPGAQISITVGDMRGTLTLAEAASVVGIEVRPTRVEGTDPESEQPILNLDLYVASGQVVWMDAAKAAPETLTGPQHWSWPAAVTDETATQIPPWVLDVEDIAAIDRKAAESMAQIFAEGRPARLELKQLADHRKSEIRSLAVRCLAAIGNYDALIKSLGDDTIRAGWRPQVDALRSALAQGPESAARVRTSLERLRGARSSDLYRMLWGYSDAQLKSGMASELVEHLDDEMNLDTRVVAFCTLERIAGKGQGYRPADNPKSRQPYLQRWRQWAADYQAGTPAATGTTFP